MKWQDKTRGGHPVENVRPNNDSTTWRWVGNVIEPDGTRLPCAWTKNGYLGADERPRNADLIPLESPTEPVQYPPLDPAKVQTHNRMVLALAATQYKRACDATEAAEEAERRAQDALAVAFEAYGVLTVVVNIDGAAILFEFDGDVGYAEVQVL